MTLEEYLDLTYRQFIAIKMQIRDQVEREDFRTGLLDCRIRQIAGEKKAQWFDAFPEWKKREENKKKGRRAVQNNIKNLYQALKKRALGTNGE